MAKQGQGQEMYNLTRVCLLFLEAFNLMGKITLIGCGGVSSGEDAYKKIRAGTTLVQHYTTFAYGGPSLIPQMKVSSWCYSSFVLS
ncbi:hypothetical protein Dimus_010131 [Dionaea muscipula]